MSEELIWITHPETGLSRQDTQTRLDKLFAKKGWVKGGEPGKKKGKKAKAVVVVDEPSAEPANEPADA